MPLGQFRDTFIIAVDEDGIAIIDQHVAHERVLFERITERLTSGRLESQRLLEPLLVEMSAAGRQALVGHAARARTAGIRRRGVRGRLAACLAFPAVLTRERVRGRAARARRGSRGPRSGIDGGGRAEENRCDDGLSCGGQGELPADHGEDGAHPGGASPHGLLDDLPPRAPGHAAADTARSREKLSANLSSVSILTFHFALPTPSSVFRLPC